MTDLIKQYVDKGLFTDLFVEELGWDRPRSGGQSIQIRVDDESHTASEAATFRGIAVWVCSSLPGARTQRAIDREIKGSSQERLLIFHDGARQEWRWPQTGNSDGGGSGRLVRHPHAVGKGNLALQQRLEQVRIGLDEDPGVVELTRRLKRAFDADAITKAFYSRFNEKHQRVAQAITGLVNVSDDESSTWYAALVLNRLMFIYFIQRKGFLNGDRDYLRNRLKAVEDLPASTHPESFYEFYRDFLLPLFHHGLGAASRQALDVNPAIRNLIGDVPYINGGIFAPHTVEETNDIRIPNEIFADLFDFFDDWQWHLDDRPTGNDREINPDVLGHIFEQFVNYQEGLKRGESKKNADKGAYYTKEDVTGYMTSSTLLPLFLERLQAATGINPWTKVAADPRRYIWDSVKHGADLPLPAGLESALLSGTATDGGGTDLPDALALPAESGWEVLDRRRWLDDLTTRLASGEVNNADATVDVNVDLLTLAIDVIDAIDSPEDLVAAWNILTRLAILDPTCGSGAFLFAALNILGDLYGAILDAAAVHAKTADDGELRDLLNVASTHPSRSYFVLKHAALNILYGVDIMPEAVEIARLRLFLKLISQVDQREQIEPLPDLEFNIRSGNALVGAASIADITAKEGTTNYADLDDLTDLVGEARGAYKVFAAAQEENAPAASAKAKSILRESTNTAADRLDSWWHSATGGGQDLSDWRDVHDPFHWFVEFTDVIANGGFDIVIGNPPYVATTKIDYAYNGFHTEDVRDIYAPVMERAVQVTAVGGRFAMIVPMNLSWGGFYSAAREMLVDAMTDVWVTTYDQMPSKLFEGANTRNTIVIAKKGEGPTRLRTAMFNKWPSDFRPHLMETQHYILHDQVPEPWPKVGHTSLRGFATMPPAGIGAIERPKKSKKQSQSSALLNVEPDIYRLGYKKTANYWLSVFVEDPPALDGQRKPVSQTKVGDLYFANRRDQMMGLAVAASRTMFLWWIMTGDAFDVTPSIFESFPVAPEKLPRDKQDALVDVGQRLEARLASAGDHLLWTPYAGRWMGNFDLTECRDITDDADTVLLEALGLSQHIFDYEVELWNYNKSGGERPGTVRGPRPDRDRT